MELNKKKYSWNIWHNKQKKIYNIKRELSSCQFTFSKTTRKAVLYVKNWKIVKIRSIKSYEVEANLNKKL